MPDNTGPVNNEHPSEGSEQPATSEPRSQGDLRPRPSRRKRRIRVGAILSGIVSGVAVGILGGGVAGGVGAGVAVASVVHEIFR